MDEPKPGKGDMRGHYSAYGGIMDTHRIIRDGDLDLAFIGEEIGTGSHGWGGNSESSGDWHRGVDVTIYLTKAEALVVHVHRWSRWQGESDSDSAEVFETTPEVLEYLRQDNGGELGRASKEAWEAACKSKHELVQGKDVEVIA